MRARKRRRLMRARKRRRRLMRARKKRRRLMRGRTRMINSRPVKERKRSGKR